VQDEQSGLTGRPARRTISGMTALHSIHPGFTLFRAREAPSLDESALMSTAPMSEAVIAGSAALYEAGMEAGHQLKVLFAMPGMSLTHVWFKSGFPLPRHSHDCDCLYYIIAGSVRIGTEALGKGDGFLVGKDVPYTYTPGPDGVELLEFRTSNAFDIKLLADNPAFWTKALETVKGKQGDWALEAVPSA
jgi:hypothetical protein